MHTCTCCAWPADWYLDDQPRLGNHIYTGRYVQVGLYMHASNEALHACFELTSAHDRYMQLCCRPELPPTRMRADIQASKSQAALILGDGRLLNTYITAHSMVR